MKFRLTQLISLQRGQTFSKPAVFVACLVGITTVMVGLMGFLIPPTTTYTEGVWQWKNSAPLFLAPSETCAEASQICAGVTVPARTASGNAEAGPYYGCLSTVPNPTWLYVKIATSGTLSFSVSIAPSSDVDFAAWGPFTGPTCGAALNSAKLKSCDYAGTNGGTANLGNVVAGEYYMILLTNFGNAAGNISLTINAGSTASVSCPSPGGAINSLKLWFKGDAGTNTTTNGGVITQWTDQGGQGKNVTQATAANQPLFVSNGINFNPAVNYDGINDYLVNTTTGITGGDKTMFAVSIPNTLLGTIGLLGGGGTASESEFGYQSGLLNMYENIGNNALATTPISVGVPTISTGMEATNALSFFNNGNANGTGSYTSTPATVRFTVGAHTLGAAGSPTYKNYWPGYISEVILYDAALSLANREKIESYLGIKYGITLGHNYLNGVGTVVWDKTTNATYHNNVTGIGRDDVQGLNQKQSKSVNANALVTMGNTAIAATNSANTNAFAVDNAFEIFGDDNTALTWQTTESPATRQRVAREWKVDETGTVGSVKIQVPDNSSVLATKLPAASGAVYLLTDADGDFSVGATATTMTLNGTNWEANVDFTDGQYFTFAMNIPIGPGCVTTNLSVWFKADANTYTDAGITLATNGQAVQQWNNAATNAGLAAVTQATAAKKPLWQSASFNFNPSVKFTGTADQYLTRAATLGSSFLDNTNTTVYAVAKTTGSGFIYGWQAAGSLTDKVGAEGSTTGMFQWYYGTTNTASSAANFSTASIPQLGAWVIKSSGASNLPYANGAAGTAASANAVNLALSNDFNIGEFRPTYPSSPYTGEIAELIIYKDDHNASSAASRLKIESYLGLKYGITLGHNYVNSANTIIYPVATHSNNVFGIGREDCQTLYQKQSKSVNTNGIITVGLKNIAATNVANTNTLADATFLVIGDDGVAAASSALNAATVTACTPPIGLDVIFNRKWKAIETGTVDSTLISVPVANLTGITATQPVYFVTADDAAFTVNVKFQAMTTNGVNREILYNFNGTKYFTFAGTGTSTTYCTGSHYIRWNTEGWAAGALTKNVTLAGGLTMNTVITDPNSIILSGYPRLYQGLPMTYISTKNAAHAITWTSTFNQKVSGVSFSVYDIDNVGTLMEQVDVKGYNGATLVTPIFTKPAVSFVTVSGTTVSGLINNTSTYSPFAKVNISFNQTIDKVVITYKNNKNTLYKRGAAMLISDFSVYCPEPVITPDLIALSKMAPTGSFNIGDTLTYTFKLNNADCAAKTVNFSDVLPAGFTWVANSYISPIAGGTINSYAGTNTLTITGLSVPTGITSFTADVIVGGTAGTTKNNQASVIVPLGMNTTILSDDPLQAGTSDPTPVLLATPPPTAPLSITKAVSPNSVLRTGTVNFTYTFNNTHTSPITVEFTDELQLDTASYKASSLALGAGLTGAANAYGGDATLSFASLSVPVGTSSFTVQVDMNNVIAGTYANTATILPASGGFNQVYKTSNEVNWTVVDAFSTFSYAYNCLGSQVLGNFAANGIAGQTGSVTIALDGSFTGATTFTVTGTNFTGSLSTTILAGQATVTIPITYNGSGTEGSRTLTVTSPQGTGSCTATAIIQAACKAEGGRIGQ